MDLKEGRKNMKNLKNAISYLAMNDRNGNYEEIIKEVEADEITLEQAKKEVADILNRWIDENLAPSDIKDRQTMENLIESLVEKEGEKMSKKRIDIVSTRIVKEYSILYATRRIESPEGAADLMKDFLEDLDREQVMLLCLNTKGEPTHISTVSTGSLTSSIVHPREVFKTAIIANANQIMIFHNHPSGDPTPSEQDLAITKRLKEAGELIGIELLDHIIIGDQGRLTSLKRLNYL